MKKQNSIYFALVIILIAVQACNAGSTTSDSAGGSPTAIPALGEPLLSF